MRFLLDHDVDAAVGRMLRQRGHTCWTAGAAGLARARDDELTVWAGARQAAVVSTDEEFGLRRMGKPIGWHLWLGGADWSAGEVLAGHLEEVLAVLASGADLTVRVSGSGVERSGEVLQAAVDLGGGHAVPGAEPAGDG
jgi:predicted nuclease of predicted toxin-antitoxin system